MKYVVIIIDGAADYPIDVLGGKTPMEVAHIFNMNKMAQNGVLGRVRTVPPGFSPASDVANLSLLGYDPQKYYTGRGPLEAANLGVKLGPKDLAFRCNLVTENDGKLSDYSAGHVTDKEAKIVMSFLNEKLGSERVKFYPGTSYRNLMVFKDALDLGLTKLKYFAPHDIMGQSIARYMPKGKNNGYLIDLMKKSKEILADHEINTVRVDLGENPANMIWLWGCGQGPTMEPFKQKFGLDGAVISAVDLINGIGRIIGFDVVKVEGATGYYDTNYLGKAQGAINALKTNDFVFLHVEATDEAGHNGDLRMKITCLERIDRMVLRTLLDELEGQDYRILITPDHPTPVAKRTHTKEPVPFLIYGKGIKAADFRGYSEVEAQNSALYFENGKDLLTFFLES